MDIEGFFNDKGSREYLQIALFCIGFILIVDILIFFNWIGHDWQLLHDLGKYIMAIASTLGGVIAAFLFILFAIRKSEGR